VVGTSLLKCSCCPFPQWRLFLGDLMRTAFLATWELTGNFVPGATKLCQRRSVGVALERELCVVGVLGPRRGRARICCVGVCESVQEFARTRCFVLFCFDFPLLCSFVTMRVSFCAVCCIGSFGSPPIFRFVLCD